MDLNNITEQEILQVLREAHPDVLPLSTEDIVRQVEHRRKWALEEADISAFAEMVDDWIKGMFEVQSSTIRWTAVVMYLEKVIRDIRPEMAEMGMEVRS